MAQKASVALALVAGIALVLVCTAIALQVAVAAMRPKRRANGCAGASQRSAPELVAAPEPVAAVQSSRHPLQVLTPENADACYAMLEAFDQAAKRAGVKWWAEGGTLLGALRSGGILPFDDDLDVDVPQTDESKLVDVMMPELAAKGYTFVPMKFGWKMFAANGTRTKRYHQYGYPALDVFVVKEDEHGVLRSKCGSAANCFPKCYFEPSEVEDVVEVPFGPVTAMIPKHPLPYLTRCYDASWNDQWIRWYDHAREARLTRQEIKWMPVLPADRVFALGSRLPAEPHPCTAP